MRTISAHELTVRVLGPVDVVRGGSVTTPRAPMQRALLAALALRPGVDCSLDSLLEDLWGPAPPRSAVATLRNYVRRLRTALPDVPVETTRSGYRLDVEPERVDVGRFISLVTAAREQYSCDLFEQALSLWRGDPLGGVGAAPLRLAEGPRLIEMHLDCVESSYALRLDQGRHAGVIPHLIELTALHPLREKLCRLLMLALHREGRTAEALDRYRQLRDRLIQEAGIEPGAELRALHAAVLDDDATLLPAVLPTRAVGPPTRLSAVPAMLPADLPDFTGRAGEIERIVAALSADGSTGRPPVAVVVTGAAGIGTSSVALHAAHAMRDSFPGGLLYADIGGERGLDRAQDIAGHFLVQLGYPPASVPRDPRARSAVLRGALADRRALVVLDDTDFEEHVAALSPGSGPTRVLVASRRPLAALPGAARVEVGPMSAGEARELLEAICGRDRLHGQDEDVAVLLSLCEYLPLAIRIVGARLVSLPHRSVASFARRLTAGSGRLDELTHHHLSVRASLSVAYESLTGPARRAFRFLGALGTPTMTGLVAGALLDVPAEVVGELFDELAEARLVAAVHVPESSAPAEVYRTPRLIRSFADERLRVEETSSDSGRAVVRALWSVVSVADHVHTHVYGGRYLTLLPRSTPKEALGAMAERVLAGDPIDWLDRERPTIVAGVSFAAAIGDSALCWNLALCGVTLFEVKGYYDTWRSTHLCAMDIAQRYSDARGEAVMRYSLAAGALHRRVDVNIQRQFEDAVDAFERTGDHYGAALARRYVAFLDRFAGRLARAQQQGLLALAAFQDAGDPAGEAYVLRHLAQVHLERAESATSMALLEKAERLCERYDLHRQHAQVLFRIAEVALENGRSSDAATSFSRVLAMVTTRGDPVGRCFALVGLSSAQIALGDLEAARESLHDAEETATPMHDIYLEARIAQTSALLSFAVGQHDDVLRTGRIAERIFADIGVLRLRSRLLEVMSISASALGETADAARYATDARHVQAELDAGR